MRDDAPARMTVNFMGLTGPSGVLPYAYSQFILERGLARDRSFADFIDLFHHRLLSLFYKAWEKHRFTLRYERTGDDPVTRHLRDLEGLGLETERRIGTLAAEHMAGYAGLLGPEPRSAVCLEQLVSDWFNVPVAVEQFLGGWYRVEATDQCALDDGGISSRLGVGALVGDEVWDPQARVRLRIGPLDRVQYESFLPTGQWYEPLRSLVRLFGHDQFEVEAQLVLRSADIPGLRLGRAEDTGERLGWSSWIRTRPRETVGDETVLQL
jgi:type VI secretion system protein ImpH